MILAERSRTPRVCRYCLVECEVVFLRHNFVPVNGHLILFTVLNLFGLLGNSNLVVIVSSFLVGCGVAVKTLEDLPETGFTVM